MTYPAADDPVLPETGTPPAALDYRPADTDGPRHSRLGVAALAAALLSPVTMLALTVVAATGIQPPPVGFIVTIGLAVWGGPVVGLALGTAALLAARGPRRRRRWPAVVAVTVSVLTIALLGALILVALRR